MTVLLCHRFSRGWLGSTQKVPTTGTTTKIMSGGTKGNDLPLSMLARMKSPGAPVARVFGGVEPLAQALGRSRSSVYRWCQLDAPSRAGVGLIPVKLQRPILELAIKRRLDVTAADIILGRELPDQSA